jgi:8-oxo-dGTP pyrophosphatase MutT (NUDIX family)
VSDDRATYSVWDGDEWVVVPVPMSGSEGVMIPVLRVVVVDESGNRILLQRRDAGGETVRGLLEIPGGRWRSGESPADCATREVFEETGIRLSAVDGVAIDAIDDKRSIASIRPLVVVAGVDGGFPAVHTVLVARGAGSIVAEAGASTDVRWWPISEVLNEMATNRRGFIPSSFAALAAYAETLDSGI